MAGIHFDPEKAQRDRDCPPAVCGTLEALRDGKWRIAIYITNADCAPDFVERAIERAHATTLV
jgi:hypothetical protein